MGILLWVVFGLVAGSAARLVMPGPRAGGLSVAIPLGIGGAVLGGLVGTFLGGAAMGIDFRSLLMAVTGALAALISYRAYAMRALA